MGTVRAWMVRAGADGEREDVSISEGLTVAGWPEVGDLTGCMTPGDLKAELAKAYPARTLASLATGAGNCGVFVPSCRLRI